MNAKLTLDMDSLTVTSFETGANTTSNAGPSNLTAVGCCPGGCNTRLTCSSNLC